MTWEKQGKPVGCNICSQIKNEKGWLAMNDTEKRITRPSLFLHSCCGPCSTSVVERLASDYEITVYFYNPNVTDEVEYETRKAAQISFIEQFNENPSNPYTVRFKEGPYDKRNFAKVAEGMEKEPEGGKRCEQGFILRLEKTAETASMLGYDTFATTLTVSPHKDYEVISRIGKRLSIVYGVGFLDMDFKKKAGFQRSIELSKKYNLYRQNYCGCDFANHNLGKQED